jgi:hypothetical protein
MTSNAFLLAALIVATSAWSADKSGAHHDHAAHSHGQGQLELVVQGDVVQLDFEIPMESLLGHEHLPKTPAQKKAMAELQVGAAQANYLVVLPAAAVCQLQSAQARSDMFLGKKSEHSDLDVQLQFKCSKPAALQQIELAVFKRHPLLKSLKVDMITPKGQGSTTLKPKDPVIRW